MAEAQTGLEEQQGAAGPQPLEIWLTAEQSEKRWFDASKQEEMAEQKAVDSSKAEKKRADALEVKLTDSEACAKSAERRRS